MPTQRPFLSNFLAAFRAHSQQIPQGSKPLNTTSAVAASATVWTSNSATKPPGLSPLAENAVASPRPIKSGYNNQTSTATGSTAAYDNRYAPTSLSSPLQHNVSPQTHLPRPPPSPSGLPVYGPPNRPQPSYPTPQETSLSSRSRARRRGSDSSSESGGFREVRGGGGETWFIGGKTPAGEEKYYKLSMIRRDMSSDRLSADRLSL